MRETTIESLRGSLREFIDSAQEEDILILDGEEPVAIVHGLREPDDDAEYWVEDDPELLALLRDRANEPTIPWDDAMKILAEES